MCQNTYHDDRPMVLLANPNHLSVALLEKSNDKQIRLCAETRRIAHSFQILSFDTWKHLYGANISIPKIAFDLGVWLNKPLLMATDIQALRSQFHDLRVSWFNFQALYFLAEQFLFPLYPNVLSHWINYCVVFKEYCSNRCLRDFTNIFFEVEDENIFLVEVDECHYDFTLADVENFRKSLSIALDVPEVSLHLVTVRQKCLIIYFYYCYSDYLTRFKSLSSQQLNMIALIKPHKILSLTDLYNQFKHDNIQSYYFYEVS